MKNDSNMKKIKKVKKKQGNFPASWKNEAKRQKQRDFVKFHLKKLDFFLDLSTEEGLKEIFSKYSFLSFQLAEIVLVILDKT